MSLTITKTKESIFGNTRVRWGTFLKTAEGTSESFITGLKKLDWFNLQVTESGTSTSVQPKISSATAFPLSTGTVTVHFDTGTVTGIWKAEGL